MWGPHRVFKRKSACYPQESLVLAWKGDRKGDPRETTILHAQARSSVAGGR